MNLTIGGHCNIRIPHKKAGELISYYDDLDTDVDFREHPEQYYVGRGEQGVLMVEPYKSELLPHWRFKTPAIAKESSQKLYEKIEEYRHQDDFVGMDMARKYIQMGYTRSRRYANYKGGKKYQKDRKLYERQINEEKTESAAIFKKIWDRIREDNDYLKRKKAHQKQFG